MKKHARICWIAVVLLAVLLVLPVCGAAEETVGMTYSDYEGEIRGQGRIGENLEFAAYYDGTVFVYGSGEPYPNDSSDYSENWAHWYSHATYYDDEGIPARIVFEDGITAVSNDLLGSWVNEVVLPESVTEIADGNFEGCSGLKRVTLPQSICSIGEDAFADCPDVVAAVVMGSYAHEWCVDYEIQYIDVANLWFVMEGSVLVEYTGTAAELQIPAELGITEIGEAVFKDDDFLVSVVIPEGVVSIGDSAFSGCSALESVSFPETLKSVGDYAFADCSGVQFTQIDFPEGIETIGEYAFAFGNENFETVILPNAEVAVGAGAFDSHVKVHVCDWIYRVSGSEAIVCGWIGSDENLTVPDALNTLSVAAFDPGVFRNKTFLKEVALPDGVHTLGNALFYGCTALTGADLGESAQELPAQLFFGCRQLKSVQLPGALKKVDRYAFYNCVVLGNVSMPAGVEEIGANAFGGCAGLVEAPLPASLKILGDNVFYGCNSLNEVDIPDAVTNLGEGIFNGCTALETVNVGKGVDYIGSKTFAGLKSLKHLTIESDATVTIASSAFENCTALQDVTVTDAQIQSGAFQNCSALRTFEADAAGFTSSAFNGCSLLRTVSIGQVKSLPSYAFLHLPSLEYVYLGMPVSAMEIPYQSFAYCRALKTVDLGWNWTGMGSNAFFDCSALENIALPDTVRSISDYAFSGCGKLQKFEMPDALTTIGSNAFSSCSALSEIKLNAELNAIYENAFAGCTALGRVDLPDGVQTVGKGAFPNQARIYCNPASAAAISISANGGSFVSPENEMFSVRLLLDGDISLGLSVEQIWTEETEVQIPEYIGGETVTQIGASVFVNCPGVTTVTLPASVPVLPAGMLKDNSTLTTVIIPEGVTGIGNSAFQNCSKLSSVEIPSTVTSIGDNAFDGCSMLKELQLPDSIQEVGADAFKGIKVYCGLDSDTARMLSRTGGGFVCREYPLLHLKYLFVGGEAVSLEVIGAESGVAAVEIPDSVTSIAENAFRDMTSLKSVVIPDSVTSIGASAFNGSGVTSIALPAGVAKIENYTFANTASLKEITFAGAVKEVGAYAFENSAVTAVEFKDGLESVGEYAFNNALQLRSAVLPDSTKSLGGHAFYGCKTLTSFKVPAGVETIPAYAFYDCGLLEAVDVPEGVTEIDAYAFSKSGLASISLPSTMRRIEGEAFEYCVGLKSVQMSGDMEYLGSYAFANCTNLETLKLPDTLTEMVSYAFRNCDRLETVELPAGLTIIPHSAFESCENLGHVSIPEGVQKIEGSAFNGNSMLESVDLPSTLIEIGESAFYNCNLKTIDLPEGLKQIKAYAFRDNDMLTGVVLPEGLSSLENYAFYECRSLESIVIPGNLLSLPQACFSNCIALQNVTIEEGVRSISDNAFVYCYRLGAVLIPRSVSSISDNAFYGINADVPTVYCYHDTEGERIALEKGFGIVYLDGEDMLEGLTVEALETEISIGLGKELPNVDKMFAIKPENIPYNAQMSFYVEDEEIAAVENGVLTGLRVGETNLVGCLAENNDILARIKVYVRENVTDFTLPDEIWQLRSEELTLMPVSTTPEGANDGYKWTLKDNLGIIENNVLKPSACGTTTLTALSWNGVERSTVLHIYDEPTKVGFVNVPAGADVGTQIALEPEVQAGAVFTGELANHFLTYSSSDDSIAAVTQDGVVTTVGYGTAVISARTENNVVGKAYIYVSAPISSFNLQGRVLAAVGSTIELAATEIQPANANPNAFVWTTEPEGLVSYANGRVTVLTDQEAEVTITATSWDGALSKSTHMTIYRPDVESIHIEPVEWVEPYKYIQLTARVKAVEEFTNQLVTWSIDEEYNYYDASIDQNGMLYTGNGGWGNEITVTATADNGVSDSMTLCVVYPTGSFELPERIILQTGATKTVTPTKVFSESGSELDASYRKFSMRLNSGLLASVDGMTITGVKPGMAELTVTSWNGVARKVPVLVYDPITSIDVNVKESQLPNALYSTDLLVQKYYSMQSLAHGDQVYENDLLTWTSSDPSVIRVEDENTGRIRTVNYGTATITATAENGVTGSIELNVRKEVDTFALPAEIEAHVLSDKELQVASVTPADAYDAFVWTVEPASLGTIEGNILHVAADAPAEGRLIATSWEGYVTKETKLSIIQEPVSQISIEPVGRMNADSETKLVVHVTAGAEYLNRWVSFSSSDERIAKVDADGTVHACAPGLATITAKADSGVEASVTFEVIRGVSAFNVPEKIWLECGRSVEIGIEGIEPDDSLKEFVWTSASDELLTVEPGELCAVLTAVSEKAADTTVTVKSWNGVERSIEVAIYEPATKVELSGMPAGIAPDDQVSLRVSVEAGNTFGKELVSFRSTDETVAVVDEDGVVTAVGYGSAEIIAEAKSGASDSVTVRVSKPIADFSLPARFLAAAGTTIELQVNDVLPADAQAGAIEWSIEPAELGVIEGNRFTAAVVDGMTGTVTATGWDGSVVKSTVLQVYKPQVTDITFDSVPRLWCGAEYQLVAHVYADGTDFINELVTFSSDTSYITVDENGMIRCADYGWSYSGTITATAENGVSASVYISVSRPITDFTLDENLLLQTGSSERISIRSYSGDSYGWTYRADDSGVVSVDENGWITANKPGDAVVTVKAWSGLEKTLNVHVHDAVTEVIIDPVAENQRIIEEIQLNVRVIAEREYGDELITWTTSNSRIATVSETGLVKTLNYGEVTITATAGNGVSASIPLRVAREVASFTLPAEYTAYAEGKLKLEVASIAPENAHNEFVWTVEPAQIGVIENGVLVVEAREACEGTLTAVSWDGNVTRTAALRIVKEEVTDVKIDPVENGEILVGETVQLVARVTAGIEHENCYVRWKSSDEEIATVSQDGLVTPLACGSVTITATSDNGLRASVELTVLQGVDSFEVPESITVYSGYPEKLEISNIQPANAEDRPFSYVIEPAGIAEIEDGMIVPMSLDYYDSVRTGTITVTSWNGVSRTIDLTVKFPTVSKIEIEPLPELHSDMTFRIIAKVTVDGKEYTNHFVRFQIPEEYDWMDEQYYTIDSETGEVRIGADHWDYEFACCVYYNNGYSSQSVYGHVDANITDFEIVPPANPLKFGDEIVLTAENFVSPYWEPRTDVVWSVEPADAVSLEDNVLTVLTKDAVDVTVTASAWNGLVRTCTFTTVAVQEVESFTLPSRILLPVGGTAELKFNSISPEGIGADHFTWTVEPEGAAVVENGVLRALTDHEMTAELTATSWNGVSQTTMLQIYAPNVTAIELEPVTLYRGVETQLRANVWVDGVEYVNQFVTFEGYVYNDPDSTLENHGYGSLTDDGYLWIYDSGSDFDLYVKLTAANGFSIVEKFKVYKAFDSIEIADCIVLPLGESKPMTIDAYAPEEYGEPYLYNYSGEADVLFSAADEEVVRLDHSGYPYIYGMKVGETTLTARSRNGAEDTARVVVYDTIEDLTIDSVGPQRIYDNVQMTANVVVNGMTVSNKLVTWTTDDPAIATINANGVVRTVGYGTVTVTATAVNGLSASTEFLVSEDTQDFTIPEGMSVDYGDKIELYVCDVIPEYVPQEFTWTVEPADAASIEGDILTPLLNQDMQLTVTATSWDGLSRSQIIQVYAVENRKVFELPAALKVVGEEAFEGCIMFGVVLPDGCESIGNRAFADSANLYEVYIPESVSSIADDAFDGCPSVCIFAPAGSYAESYAAQKGIPFAAN